MCHLAETLARSFGERYAPSIDPIVRDEWRKAVVTKETAPVDPNALRHAREQKRISQRELGRRLAARLGTPKAARALQVRLGRIERGDRVSEEDHEMIDALAAELAVGTDDLVQTPVWVWIKLHNGRPRIVELALRMPSYSTPELAYQARDVLAHVSNGHFKPFADAQLVPMRVKTLREEVLDVNYPDLDEDERKLLIAVDPDEDVLPSLAALDEVVAADEPVEWMVDGILNALDRFNLVGEIVQLHDLALRRLTTKPPAEDADVVAAWRRREERLYDLLERYHQRRRDRRAEALAAIPS